MGHPRSADVSEIKTHEGWASPQASPTPVPSTSSGQALRQEREGQGTHYVGDASEIKSLGHPQ